MAKLGFSLDDVKEEMDSYGLVPDGTYKAVIVKADAVKTKAGNGHYLNMKLQLPEYGSGKRFIFDPINFDNPNETAARIGKSRLKSIYVALGLSTSDPDIDELLNKTLNIRVGKKFDSYSEQDKNVIYAYSTCDDAVQEVNPSDHGADNTPDWAKQ